MSTSLEKYLKKEREKLDVEYPDDDAIWTGIRKRSIRFENSSQHPAFSRLSNMNLWKIAAIVTIILSVGYVTFDIVRGNQLTNRAILSSINTELGARENDYIQAVKLKEKELRELNIPRDEIISTLFEELKIQDALYKETIEDVRELGDNDQVINNIFNIYERRIELLERIIIETNKIYNNEKSGEVNI